MSSEMTSDLISDEMHELLDKMAAIHVLKAQPKYLTNVLRQNYINQQISKDVPKLTQINKRRFYDLGASKERQGKSQHIILTSEQKSILEHYYKKMPNWNASKIGEISKRLDLPRIKVYKWNWDRKRKSTFKSGQSNLSDNEQEEVQYKNLFQDIAQDEPREAESKNCELSKEEELQHVDSTMIE